MCANNEGAAKTAKIAKIEVWWDMKDCPIPEGYDARRVRPSIEKACKERGYNGPVSITAYGDQKQTPCQQHMLRGLSSTGVAVAHTISEATCSLMYRDIVEWRDNNPPPATMMIISDKVEGEFSWDLARLQQRTRYNICLVYSVTKSYNNDKFMFCYENWCWKQLLEKGGGEPLVDRLCSSAPMFYCKSCNFDCRSLEKFRKHLSSYKHGWKEFINTDTRLVCVTKTWRRNYRATLEHATAKIQVWWDMAQCPVPDGYDARLVRPSIEAAFEEIGYYGPVSITAYSDHKETPSHVLLALTSTGVEVAHTLRGLNRSRIYTDVSEWTTNNPAPASLMLISNDEHPDDDVHSLISRYLQMSDYNCFLAYSFRPCQMTALLTSAEWLWESLLAVSEKRSHVLQKGRGSDRAVASPGMFYCKVCRWYYESLDEFNEHFSGEPEHEEEENRIISRSQENERRHMENQLSNYHHQVGYSPKNKRMRKAPRK